jgi:hypothetical protein
MMRRRSIYKNRSTLPPRLRAGSILWSLRWKSPSRNASSSSIQSMLVRRKLSKETNYSSKSKIIKVKSFSLSPKCNGLLMSRILSLVSSSKTQIVRYVLARRSIWRRSRVMLSSLRNPSLDPEKKESVLDQRLFHWLSLISTTTKSSRKLPQEGQESQELWMATVTQIQKSVWGER